MFRIEQAYETTQAIYLRTQSVYSHVYTIDFYNEAELQHARVNDYCLNSFLFGILLMVVIINLIIYFTLQSRICLIFSLCVFLISAHQGCTTGIYNVLFPKHSDRIMQFSIEIGILYLISIIVFFMIFSEVKTLQPVYALCSKGLIAACLMGYPLCLMDRVAANFYAHMLSVIPALFILYASLRLYFTGRIKHAIFLLGWNITTMTYVFMALFTEGILHLQNNYIMIHGTIICIVTVSILFTIAMVSHAKLMQLEHQKIQQQMHLTAEKIKRTETALLQTQIKPHFLYNTLTAIESLCEIDIQKAQTAIADFAGFLHSKLQILPM